jgi:hypothetical protein
MSKAIRQFALPSLLFFCSSLAAYGAGGTGIYELDWDNPSEVLEYHSCGCGDACWVAELRNRKTKQLKARLACDCEKLYASFAEAEHGGTFVESKSNRVIRDNCSAFETHEENAKPKEIAKTMKSLLKRSPMPSNTSQTKNELTRKENCELAKEQKNDMAIDYWCK